MPAKPLHHKLSKRPKGGYLLTLVLLSLGLAGCGESPITEIIVKAEEKLRQAPGAKKENLFGTGSESQDASPRYNDSNLSPETKARVDKILDSNPENKILKSGSLCNDTLFEDTSRKIFNTLENNGYGEKFKLGVGVTALPEGAPKNRIWSELWKVYTPKGTVNYPIVFIEDGQGEAFFLSLRPYNENEGGEISSVSTIADTGADLKPAPNSKSLASNDSSPNFFNLVKPMLSKNNSKGRIKYTILYFSASWCGPCQQFTPILAQWYLKTKRLHPEMEIVFVSSDRSQDDFNAYAQKMPWAHLAFEHKDFPEIRKYSAPGIPFLVLVNENGLALTEQKHPTETLPVIEGFITGKDPSELSPVKTGLFD